MATTAPARRTFTVSFPAGLATQVEQLAQKESRTTSELFREAFRTYRAQQLKKALAELNAIGRSDSHKGYSPDDVEPVVHEGRDAKNALRRAINK